MLHFLGLGSNNMKLFELTDLPVQFHTELNPKIWKDKELLPEVSDHLKAMVAFFRKKLKLEKLKIVDVTLCGSNAAYTYTKYSDIDCHLIVRVPKDEEEVLRNLLDARKILFTDTYNFSIHGISVEMYVQFEEQPHSSMGVYSLMHGKWLKEPTPVKAEINDGLVQYKLAHIERIIKKAIETKNVHWADRIFDKLRAYRQHGLEREGEFSPENLVFKMLRNNDMLEKLNEFRVKTIDRVLSLESIQESNLRRETIKVGNSYKTIVSLIKDILAARLYSPSKNSIAKHIFQDLLNDPEKEITPIEKLAVYYLNGTAVAWCVKTDNDWRQATKFDIELSTSPTAVEDTEYWRYTKPEFRKQGIYQKLKKVVDSHK